MQHGFVLDKGLSRRIALTPYCRSFMLELFGFLLNLMDILNTFASSVSIVMSALSLQSLIATGIYIYLCTREKRKFISHGLNKRVNSFSTGIYREILNTLLFSGVFKI